VGLFGAATAPAAHAQVNSQTRTPSVAATAPASARSIDSSGKKILGLADIGRWSKITNAALSPDGRWITYVVEPNEGDGALHFAQTDGTKRYDVPVGSTPEFSDDSRYAAYLVSPASGPPGAADASGTHAMVVSFAGPPRRFELLDLATGAKYSVPDASTFKFSKGSRFVAVRTTKAIGSGSKDGTDLILRQLATGMDQTIHNVAAYAFDAGGSMLAYTVDATDRAGNGVDVVDLSTGQSRLLNSASLDYSQLTWSGAGTALAVLRGDKKADRALRDNTLLVWRDVTEESPRVVEYDPASDPTFPKGDVLSELSELRFTRDASHLYVGLKQQTVEQPASGAPRANVDIWHWNDQRVQSEQIVNLALDRRATMLAVFAVASHKLVPLADTVMRIATPTRDARWAIGQIDTTYRDTLEWDGDKTDYYRVSTDAGARTLIDRDVARTMGSSPDGRWFLYLKDKRIHAYDLATGGNTILARADNVSFLNTLDDHPYETPTYGVAGWSADGKAVILNHRYDLYRVPLDGGKVQDLTGGVGAAQQIQFRLVRLDRAGGGRGARGAASTSDEADSSVDLSKPLLLSARGEWTKKSGYYRLSPGGKPTPLIYGDEQIGQAIKAQHADRVLFTRQTFEEPPDYWVTNTEFAAPRRVTDANPFVGEYAWGSRKLVEFTNSAGQRLQGVLTLPANYQPGKKYPMLVYVYETLSNTYHTFAMPVFDDRPHFAEYASDGYLVFEPDIVYQTGKPGTSALDCVTRGVQKVIDMGYADPAHIGLQGHSWGGYESSYILAKSRMFAGVVTGAPPVDLTSFYDETYPGTGELQQGITELGQVRMGTNPWDSPALYADQSPITHVKDITSPFLILQGTADDAVDPHQGLELYAAARRLGKKVILLSYPGETHHLSRKTNQKDFQVRMKQFFDHYLKGAPAPQWMTEGVPQLLKGEATP
jgi:dienelactone hydrolase